MPPVSPPPPGSCEGCATPEWALQMGYVADRAPQVAKGLKRPRLSCGALALWHMPRVHLLRHGGPENVGLRMFALLLLSEGGDCKITTPAWADDIYPYMSTLAGGSKGPVEPPVVLVLESGPRLRSRGCGLGRGRPAWGLLAAPVGHDGCF